MTRPETAEERTRRLARAGLERQGFATCPECAARRRTIETLAVHRAIAHGIPTGYPT